MRKPREPKRRNLDLLKRFDKVNLEFFGGRSCGGVGWRHFPSAESDHIGQAYCVFDERYIRVNSVLKDTRIPLWYVDFVLYHEMLHLQHGPCLNKAGHAYPHDFRFLCMEASHPDYARAVKFEETKIPNIARSWRLWREWERSQKNKPKKKATHLRLAAKKR